MKTLSTHITESLDTIDLSKLTYDSMEDMTANYSNSRAGYADAYSKFKKFLETSLRTSNITKLQISEVTSKQFRAILSQSEIIQKHSNSEQLVNYNGTLIVLDGYANSGNTYVIVNPAKM